MVIAVFGAFFCHEPDALISFIDKPSPLEMPIPQTLGNTLVPQHVDNSSFNKNSSEMLMVKDLSSLYTFLENEGYKIVDRENFDDGDILLKLVSRGSVIGLLIEPDNDLQMRSYFMDYKNKNKFNEIIANNWNKSFRWVKAYVDDERDIVLELDILPQSKLSSQLLLDSLNMFYAANDIFKAWINTKASKSVGGINPDKEGEEGKLRI